MPAESLAAALLVFLSAAAAAGVVASDFGHCPDNEVLEQKFEATAPNKVWVTGITYIPTDEGWLYLAGHKED